MKVLLLFPPQWVPFYPYLSLPSLTAYLREKGIAVSQKDLNIEAYEMFLSAPFLTSLQKRLDDKFTFLDLKDRLSGGIEQRYYNDLFLAKNSLERVAQRIENAKEVLRDQADCYNPEKLRQARDTINHALGIISAAHFPTQLRLTDLEMPSFSGSYEDIQRITIDKEANPFFDFFEDRVLPFVKEQNPDVVGISIAAGENQLVPSLTLSRLIKESLPESHVVVGGHVVTMLADVIKNHDGLFKHFFDSAILYDGEKPLFELAKHIEQNKPLDDVPNLLHFRRGKIISNPVAEPEEINSLPTPSFDGLPIESYLSPEPVLPLLSSRGCYWHKCGFCTHSLGYGEHHTIRDAKKVADDLKTLSDEYGARHFSFSDECISPNSLNRISGEISHKDLKVRLSANIRLEKQFNSDLCAEASNAGFKLLYLGLESGNDRVLDLINKGTSTETAKKICRNVYDAGIWNHMYVMIGFPGETEKEARDTVDFLTSNKNIIHSFDVDNFQLSRGSLVAQDPKKYGIKINSDLKNQFLLTLRYTGSKGLSNVRSAILKNEFMNYLIDEYNADVIINVVDNYLPLYLSYYESKDPFLKDLKTAPILAKTQTRKHLNLKSVPTIRNGVIFERVNYDLSSLRQNIIDNKTDTAIFRSPSCVIFDINKRFIYSLQESSIRILSLCDGKTRISKIVRQLSNDFNLPELEIERFCVDFLEAMLGKGFISI